MSQEMPVLCNEGRNVEHVVEGVGHVDRSAFDLARREIFRS
jgi:hypothetical protein